MLPRGFASGVAEGGARKWALLKERIEEAMHL
jgi:hypothetical protein